MDIFRIIFIFLLVHLVITAAHGDETRVTPNWREHPYLFVERSEVPTILTKARRYPWARKILEGIRKSADEWLARKIDLPPSTGRHSVTYVCPECIEPLQTLSPTQHQCPKCGKTYSGLPYDARLYEGQHQRLADAAANLGLASILFGDKDYARKSLEILLAYADRYDSYPLVDNRGGQRPHAARISDQTLNESIWLIDIAWAYDLVLGAGVGTDAERRKIEDELLRASVETIKRYQAGKSNWQSWHNAGMAAVALCLKDEVLLDEVLHGPNGFYFQMENSILGDGAWYEGSWSYHFYALHALLRTAEAGYRSGLNLYTPEIKRAMEAPLNVSMPNGKLPAIHDATEGGFSTSLYEIAAARYGGPLFQSVLAGSKREGLNALLIGITKPRRQERVLRSVIMPDIGLAILRHGDQYASLDFGPHGGGHGHLDKLSVNYFTAGQTFAPDLGRGWPYNLPVHREWYKMTLSHNTVIVDEKPQAECTGLLESHSFDDSLSRAAKPQRERVGVRADYHTVTARADSCYPGVTMRRTLALADRWLLDVFEVESDEEHTYDWVWHGRGAFSTDLPTKPFAFDAAHPSYKYLSNLRQGDGDADWRASWALPGGTVYGLFKGSVGRTAVFCDAPDNPRTNTVHSIMLRDRANDTRFVALFSLDRMDWSDLPPELMEKCMGNAGP